MQPSLLSAVICLSLSIAGGQAEIEKYVKENATKITAISPDSTNYEDLTAVGNAIGDARVVMPGEQDHGDASTLPFMDGLFRLWRSVLQGASLQLTIITKQKGHIRSDAAFFDDTLYISGVLTMRVPLLPLLSQPVPAPSDVMLSPVQG